MKKYQIVLLVFLGIVLLAGGFLAWLCTGSFIYQSSMKKEFVIDAPVSVVCKRALNAKSLPKSEEGARTNIDVQKAVKSVTLGEPVEVEIDHPKLGKILAKIQITFEINENSVKIKGNVTGLEPNHFEQYGKAVVDVEHFSFELGIFAKDAQPGGLFQLLPSTGTTVIEISSASELKVYFREMGFVRSRVEKAIVKSRQKIIKQIETFINENLTQPTEEELTGKQKPEKKRWGLWGLMETDQEEPRQEEARPEEPRPETEEQETEEPENLDAEGIDFSALDAETQ